MQGAPQDTEITLGTGRMLLLFFTLVLVCAVFFAIGFSLGRKTTLVGSNSPLSGTGAAPAAVVRPSAVNENSPAPAGQSTDFSFYKSVAAQNANTELAPQNQPAQQTAAGGGEAPAPSTTVSSSAPAAAGYFVQVAAVSRQEDADALVEALKKKQYPAFVVNNSGADKFYHVQVGPYAELKDAEAMRARLVGDGYTPILKK